MIRKGVLPVLIFFSYNLMSQERIFKVVDPNSNRPLMGVIVYLYNLDDSLKNYTLSNRNGVVSFSDKEVNHLVLKKTGYDSLSLDISILSEIVYMYSSSKELKEVVIKSNWKSMHSKSDTIRINADSLRNNNVNTLEELLSNIEGVNIDTKGKITYQNRPVGTVLIDGEDLTLDNYQVLTKNVSETLAKNIEIYKSYDENPLLKEFRRTNNIAINIKTDKSINASGSLLLGVGSDQRNKHGGNLITLKTVLKRLQVLAIMI